MLVYEIIGSTAHVLMLFGLGNFTIAKKTAGLMGTSSVNWVKNEMKGDSFVRFRVVFTIFNQFIGNKIC